MSAPSLTSFHEKFLCVSDYGAEFLKSLDGDSKKFGSEIIIKKINKMHVFIFAQKSNERLF